MKVKVLNDKELAFMEQFFQMTQKELLMAMKGYLEQRYDNVIATKDYVVAIGDIPIALVAHLDTVFKYPPEEIYYDRVKNVMWSPAGLGADDRAGVYAIAQILKANLRPTVILTTEEEKGCIGAFNLVCDIKDAPTDLKYIIELDRQGADDCVFYSCDNTEFEEYVEDFGFRTSIGSYSDISAICPQWRVAGVNLSIGYIDEHSYSETLHITHLFNTIHKVKKMLKKASKAPYFEYIEQISLSKKTFDLTKSLSKKNCGKCGKEDYSYNLYPVKVKEKDHTYYCPDCIASDPDVHWCVICGEPFYKKGLVEDASGIVCCEECLNKW